MPRQLLLLCLYMFSFNHFAGRACAVDPYGPVDAKWTIIVMDPMAGPLACDCVQGYAQRKYEVLADHLQKQLKQSFRVVWSESLAEAMEGPAKGNAHIVIGKDSVVRAASKDAKHQLEPVVQLTDMKGGVMQHGLFVVRRESTAATILDLENHQVLWGPDECEEKSSSPRAMLEENEIPVSNGPVCNSCTIAAKQLMEMSPDTKTVAVISSYAAPLLEGCGTIKKGDLRIVGSSEEVPFISGFVDSKIPIESRDEIVHALLTMKSPELLAALETKSGFVSYGAGLEKKR